MEIAVNSPLCFARSPSGDLNGTSSRRRGRGWHGRTRGGNLGEGGMARGIADRTELAIRTEDEECESRSGGSALVPMVEAADLGDFHDVTRAGRLNRPRPGRILAQRQVGPGSALVRKVRLEDPVQMALAEDDDLVQAFAAKRAAEALRVRIP